MIERVAVLGAGTMGSQIAGLLADRGIPCDLLDLRSSDDPDRLARAAIDRLRTLRPAPVSDPNALDLITPGNFDDDLDRLAGVDWVIEAVSEDLEIKRAIWSRSARHVRPGTVISTNTSGIPCIVHRRGPAATASVRVSWGLTSATPRGTCPCWS